MVTVTTVAAPGCWFDVLGATLAARLRIGDIIGLKGELGAGKTTLARAILRAASEDPQLIVPSPTFTLVEVYETPRGTFWHFDLYRLETPEQVFELAKALTQQLEFWEQETGRRPPSDPVLDEPQ